MSEIIAERTLEIVESRESIRLVIFKPVITDEYYETKIDISFPTSKVTLKGVGINSYESLVSALCLSTMKILSSSFYRERRIKNQYEKDYLNLPFVYRLMRIIRDIEP